jgi:sensor histidine kinase YesM
LSGGPDAEKDALANLRLAQSYYATGEYRQAESALDNFFAHISYDLIDAGEIKVIKDLAFRLQKERKYQKALDYLLNYGNILDSIESKLDYLESRSEKLGVSGYQNLLQIETLQKDKQITENMLNHLMREGQLRAEVVNTQQYLIYLLSLIVILSIGTMIYILRVSKQRRLANQQLALRSLRSQMNPHFIFNALNSVNSFISVSDERSANKFLSDFSKLMRTVMENSEHDLIPLSKELEIIKIYLELENFRFKDKFSFDISIDPDLDEEAYNLPPMLLQPYIENAIWHGLRYKEGIGELIVKISGDVKMLFVEIQDNGIGRTASKELKTKNQQKSKSTALRNISERIRIFNDLHKVKIEVSISDLNNDKTGTIVKIKIPQAR